MRYTVKQKVEKRETKGKNMRNQMRTYAKQNI
jgi:hypothetical protein